MDNRLVFLCHYIVVISKVETREGKQGVPIGHGASPNEGVGW